MKCFQASQPLALSSLFIAFVVYIPFAYSVILGDIFNVKTGTAEGGLDNYINTVQL
jgi:hypothetical protein